MLRFQTLVASVLAPLLVVPALLRQGQLTTLQDALAGTQRALDVLKSLEQRLQADPAASMGLVLAATEAPTGDEEQRDQRLESLRDEVNLLQMQLDAMSGPVLGAGGAVQSALGGDAPIAPAPAAPSGISTGLDDSVRALLAPPSTHASGRAEPLRPAQAGRESEPADGAERAYSADPLRNGIACFRAGRFGEAYELFAPLDGAAALYWKARTLERMERLDDAIDAMERALRAGSGADGAAGFEQRRAQTDLEFLRWKRDFLAGLPERRKEPR